MNNEEYRYLEEVKEKLGITERDIENFQKEYDYTDNCINYWFFPGGLKPASRCRIHLNGSDICKVNKEECDKYQIDKFKFDEE